MALSLSKRFAGHEMEILRDIRLYTSIGAMMRWGAKDYIAWEKFVEKISQSRALVVSEVSPPVQTISSLPELPGMFTEARSLAEELVDAFTDRVTVLQVENKALRSRLEVLERQVMVYSDNYNKKVGIKILESLEAIRRG